MKFEYDVTDEISKQLLYKHYYMFEVGSILLKSSDKSKMYNEIEIPVNEVESAVLKNYEQLEPGELGAICNNLVIEDYLELLSRDEKKTMFHKVRSKGMSAISSALFLQQFDARQRDLLQARLAKSSMITNRWSPIWAGLAALFAFGTIVVAALEYNKSNEELSPAILRIDSTLQSQTRTLDNLQQTFQNVQVELHRIADSLKSK